jgi:hypothetical protein
MCGCRGFIALLSEADYVNVSIVQWLLEHHNIDGRTSTIDNEELICDNGVVQFTSIIRLWLDREVISCPHFCTTADTFNYSKRKCSLNFPYTGLTAR